MYSDTVLKSEDDHLSSLQGKSKYLKTSPEIKIQNQNRTSYLPGQQTTFSLLVYVFLIVGTALVAKTASAEEVKRIGVRYGATYVPLNIKTVSETEGFYHATLKNYTEYLPSFFRPMYEFNVGQVSTTGGDGYLFGVGPRVELKVSESLNLGAGFRFVYLDKHVYTNRLSRTKNYGGPRQFQYYWEANYEFNSEFSFGYRWQHMSNGMQVLPEPLKYDHNPVINTHNLVFRFNL